MNITLTKFYIISKWPVLGNGNFILQHPINGMTKKIDKCTRQNI